MGTPQDIPLLLNQKFSFDNFIVGPSNSFAHAICQAVGESPGTAYNPLFLYSKVGLGKTHLMQAIAIAVQTQQPQSRIVYTTAEKFTNELITALQNKVVEQFRDQYRDVDVLLIDDIQFITGKERTQEEFFHTFNHLYNNNKQIIITSDKPPKELDTLEERLISRFEWGITADLQPPDYETRLAILRKKAESVPQPISDDILQFLAQHFTSNIRELEGAIIRLVALNSFNQGVLTLDMAKNSLRDVIQVAERKVSADTIQKVVADHFDVSLGDLKSSRRNKSLVIPRQMAMFLVRELTDHSYPDIGELFGGKIIQQSFMPVVKSKK